MTINVGEIKKLVVVDVHDRWGCYLDIASGAPLLLPMAQLPLNLDFRPCVGDEVYVVMEQNETGRLQAKLALEEQLCNITGPAPATWLHEWKETIVYRSLPMGTFVVVQAADGNSNAIGMIHHSERKRPLRVGEKVNCRVTFVREDGRVNLSMTPRKEVARDEDAERILFFLCDRSKGAMPYSDNTSPEMIRQRFDMSKSAFKRALGKLIKEGKVEQRDDWTYAVQMQHRYEDK